MKKTAFALATLSLLSIDVQAQSSVTMYGVVDVGMSYTSKAASGSGNGSRLAADSGDLTSSRIGFKGEEALGGGWSAIFNLENGFNADEGGMTTPGTLFDRKSVVGLSGPFGTLTLGRQADFLEDIGLKYSSMQTFGGNGIKAGHLNGLDRLTGARVSNAIRFDTAAYQGFSGNLFYGFGEVAGSTTAGQSLGIGGNYANGNFGIGAAYFQSKLAADGGTAAAGDTDLRTFTLGASYKFGATKLYGAWSQVRQPQQTALAATGLVDITSAVKADIFDLGADYALTPNLHLLGGVIYDRARVSRVGAGATTISSTQINLGLDYFLSKRTDLYAIYGNQRADDANNPGVLGGAYANAPTDDRAQHVVRVGMRHKF
ncbi:porin [Herbaspirillum lusitanum]|uniref:Porin n=1 Tax=Herbaspirillum lusitanum TaxID=213312 RepID=A0ABW9ACT4_9BURK